MKPLTIGYLARYTYGFALKVLESLLIHTGLQPGDGRLEEIDGTVSTVCSGPVPGEVVLNKRLAT